MERDTWVAFLFLTVVWLVWAFGPAITRWIFSRGVRRRGDRKGNAQVIAGRPVPFGTKGQPHILPPATASAGPQPDSPVLDLGLFVCCVDGKPWFNPLWQFRRTKYPWADLPTVYEEMAWECRHCGKIWSRDDIIAAKVNPLKGEAAV